MSQKSFVPQAAKSVSQALMSDRSFGGSFDISSGPTVNTAPDCVTSYIERCRRKPEGGGGGCGV